MASYGTTTIHALRKLLGSSSVREIDDGFAALADDIDPKLTPSSSGTLASRPVSTPGSPGKFGRTYYASDQFVTYFDYGTGWLAISPKWTTLERFAIRVTQSGYGSDQIFALTPGTGLNVAGGATQAIDGAVRSYPIDPADFPDGAKMRIKVHQWNVGAASSGMSGTTLGLREITGWTGGPYSRGAGVGSTRALNNLASAAKASPGVSSAFAIPSYGWYELSGTFYSSGWGTCDQVIRAELQVCGNPLVS